MRASERAGVVVLVAAGLMAAYEALFSTGAGLAALLPAVKSLSSERAFSLTVDEVVCRSRLSASRSCSRSLSPAML